MEFRNARYSNAAFSQPDDDTPTSTNGRKSLRNRSIPEIHTEDPEDAIHKFNPKWLQKCHTARCLLVSLSLCSVVQGFIINGIVPVVISTLERRFGLSSTESGLFSSMYDIAVLIVLIPVCHWGNKGHKGRWLGWGMIMFSIGSLICLIPHFATPAYQYGTTGNGSQLCGASAAAIANGADAECPAGRQDAGDGGPRLKNWFYVLLFGQLLHGWGASPLYTIGNVYLDENVSQRSSPLYLGCYLAFSAFGPAAGFAVGGLLLGIYADFHAANMEQVRADMPKGPGDERWYGAWWLGFVLSGLLAFLFALPLLSFARKLPGQDKLRVKDINQTNKFNRNKRDEDGRDEEEEGDNSLNPDFGHSLTDLPKSCWILLRNPTFTFIMIMQTLEAFLLNGFTTFIPKVIENVFNMSAPKAALLTGAVVIPGAFFGNVLGGFIMKKLRLLVRGAIMLTLSVQIISFFLTFAFLVKCPEINIAGVNFDYDDPKVPLSVANLAHSCNANCSCSLDNYLPVCDTDTGQSYFSPCHAGCNSMDSNLDNTWRGCSCADPFAGPRKIAKLHQGYCPSSCGSGTPFFLVVFALSVLTTFMASQPAQQVSIRCVDFGQRTMALGVSWVFMRAFGSIPGAILFGVAIDKTCRILSSDCDGSSSCLRYDSFQLSMVVMGFALVIRFLNVIVLGLGWITYRPPITTSPSSNSPPERNETTQSILSAHPTNRIAPAAPTTPPLQPDSFDTSTKF